MIAAGTVMVAAGCGGTGRELHTFGGLDGIGGFVTRTITLNPRPGDSMPRIEESPSGLVHATGLQNPGVDQFLALELPWLVAQHVPTIVSLGASTLAEYVDLARRLATAPGVTAVEVNLEPGSGLLAAGDLDLAARLVTTVVEHLPGTEVLAKVGMGAHVVDLARRVAAAGARAVVVGGSAAAALRDGRPAGLSGPAIRPMALRAVGEVRRALPEVTVIGNGGVMSAADARIFFDAGAVAVQVGTGMLHDPTLAARMAAELRGER